MSAWRTVLVQNWWMGSQYLKQEWLVYLWLCRYTRDEWIPRHYLNKFECMHELLSGEFPEFWRGCGSLCGLSWRILVSTPGLFPACLPIEVNRLTVTSHMFCLASNSFFILLLHLWYMSLLVIKCLPFLGYGRNPISSKKIKSLLISLLKGIHSLSILL